MLSGRGSIALGIVGVAVTASAQSSRYVEVPGVKEFTGEMIVRPLQPDRLAKMGITGVAAQTKIARAISRVSNQVLRYIPETGEMVIQVARGSNENSTSAALMATGDYQYAEPNYRLYPARIPNDPQYGQQWHHPKVQSDRAWDLNTGSSLIISAVVDTGIDTTHPDLAPPTPTSPTSGFRVTTRWTERARSTAVTSPTSTGTAPMSPATRWPRAITAGVFPEWGGTSGSWESAPRTARAGGHPKPISSTALDGPLTMERARFRRATRESGVKRSRPQGSTSRAAMRSSSMLPATTHATSADSSTSTPSSSARRTKATRDEPRRHASRLLGVRARSQRLRAGRQHPQHDQRRRLRIFGWNEHGDSDRQRTRRVDVLSEPDPDGSAGTEHPLRHLRQHRSALDLWQWPNQFIPSRFGGSGAACSGSDAEWDRDDRRSVDHGVRQ